MKIPVTALLIEAFALPWRERRAFARALALPLLVMFAFNLLCQMLSDAMSKNGSFPWFHSVIILVGYAATMAFLAVTCHRQILLQSGAHARWGARETKYLLWSFGIWALCCGLMIVLSFVMFSLPLDLGGKIFGNENPSQITIYLVSLLYWIPLSYFFARLCPILPAVAVDRKPSIGWAWELTHGNGWRLAMLVGILPFVLSMATGLLHREEAGMAEIVLLTLLNSVLVVIEVAALSLSYKHLVKSEAE